MTGTDAMAARSARTRSYVLAAALLAAVSMLALFVARAEAVPLSGSASPLPGSNFEGGDGNQIAGALRTDWQNAGGVNHSPDPNANDDIFAGGAEGKESNPGNWNFDTHDGGSTPGKNNILDAYSINDPVSNDVFLHLAFTRGDDTGTTYMAFELNQRAELWNNGKADIPCRTTGDIIVSYQVSGNDPDVILQKWTSTTTDAATGCAKTGSLADFAAFTDNVDAQGAVNDAAIQNYLPSSFDWGPTNTIPANLFGEASLNLTTLLKGALGTPCFSFGSIWMHTRASTSDQSNLDDYIAPRPLLVRNCTATGTKFHDLNANGVEDAGEPGLAGFRIWADYDNDGVRDAGEPFDDTDANGDYSIANVQDPSGTYSLREQLTPPATGTGGWTCSAPATTGDNGDFPCSHNGIDGATTPNASGKDFGNYKQAVVKVEKQTVPDGADGSFAFTSTIPGKATFSLSDGQVNETTVNPGVYTATETLHADFNLSDITCSGDTITPNSSDTGDTATFNAQSGETITCVFTNTRKSGQLTVRKVLDPTTDPGKFDLRIGGDVVVVDGGHLAEGTRTLATGTGYTVSELGGAGTSLAKYDSAIVCKDGADTVASGPGTSLSGVPVVEGHNVICTFTNTRRKGSLTVVKELKPSDDAGRFDLKVGDDVVKAAAGDGDQGSKDVAPGDYTVSELGAGGTSLAKYDSSVSCDNGQSGQGSALADVHVDSNESVTCTITNTRRAGELTVVKDLAPDDDPGTFDLLVGADVVKAGAGDGDGGSKSVAPGDYDVSELGAGGTSLAKYDSSVSCDNGQSGQGSALADVHVDSNQSVTCTITNTRRRGSLTVVKDLAPSDDAGRFDLKVGDDVVKAAAGDGDQGSKDVAPGDYTVSELGAGGTSLAKYDSSVSCDSGQSGQGSALADVHVDSNESVTCTITNTRRQASITVVKDLKPSDDTGTFDLKVGDDVVKAGAGDGDEGSKGVAPGSYTVSELGAEGTSLDDYDSSVACEKNGQAYKDGSGTSLGGIDVDSNDEVVCTIANTRLGTVEVEKQTLPATEDSFHFTADLPGGGFDLQDDGVKTVGHVLPGTYTVTEDDPAPAYDLTDLACDDGESGTPSTTSEDDRTATIEVDPGETVRCVFTNTKRGNALVVKTEGGSAPEAGRVWTFTLSGGPDGVELEQQTDGDGGSEGVVFAGLKPGDYTLCEVGMPAGWHSSLEQVPGRVITVDQATGAIVSVCVAITIEEGDVENVAVDNVRPDIEVEKLVRLLPGGTFAKTAFAHVGDKVEYRFELTNPGVGAFVSVEFSDPRCDAGSLSGPTGDAGVAGELEKGEQWVYLCTHVVTAQDPDPLPNTATVKGTDKYGNTDTDESSAAVDVIHPAIDIEKTGPATATVGAALAYTLAVTNPGDVPFAAQDVAVTDPKCEAPPAGPNTGSDATPSQLDPGDTWTYTCTAQTAGQPAGSFVNTATVTTKDFLGRTVTDSDDFATVLEAQAVLAAEIIPGSSRLSGPSGCVRKPFKAVVRGTRIARVTFFRDGKRIKTMTAKPGQRKFVLRVKPSRAPGVHRITARVQFEAGSGTKTRTLRLSYQRCVRQVVRPRFTG